MEPSLLPWQTQAINLVEHADNPVHTDEGAKAAGFTAALVAGTTIHAYLTHPVVAAWGTSWLDHGWSELRLIAPVLDDDTVDLVPSDDSSSVEAHVSGELRTTLAIAATAPSAVEHTVIEHHTDMIFDLADGLGAYGIRAGDDLQVYENEDRAHPSVWSCIGNSITKSNHVDGPWVHVRSAITHLGPTARDAVVNVTSALVDRFDTRAGERVVLDIEASVDGKPVARIEHESIIRLH